MGCRMATDFSGKGVVSLKSASAFACVVFVFGCLCLARAPQNPDGAELVMAALQGAVLHPPGYPLQAWIGKAWLLLPFGNPAWGYSLLCLLLQSLAAFVFLLATREYGLRPLAGLVAALILFYFPPLFMLGVQPEKYALVLLFACLLLLERFWFLTGLALTQHFGLAVFLPLVLWRYSRRERPHGWLLFFAVAGIGFLAAQMSLLLLARFGGWPDWGALLSWQDVLRHTLRSDLGFLGGTKEMGPLRGQLSSLGLLCDQWGWLCLVWIVALFPAYARVRGDRTIQVLLASALLGIAALWLARLPGTNALDRAYLVRYWVICMPLMALLIGLAVEHAGRWGRWLGMAALAASLTAAFMHRQEISLGGSRVFDVYREALSRSMGRSLDRAAPHAALYVSSSDVEPFWGVRLKDGSFRFPIAGDYPWFLQRKVFELDSRIASWGGGQAPPDTAAIMKRAFELGIPLVTTTPEALPVTLSWKNHALYYESSSAGGLASSSELTEVAESICGAMIAYGQDTPPAVRYGSLELWELLRTPFRLLSDKRTQEAHSAPAAQAETVYRAMQVGGSASALTACGAFLKERGLDGLSSR